MRLVTQQHNGLNGAIEQAIRIFERVWPLIRGAPHNRLAWLVVAGGVLVISGPMWEPFLRGLVQKVFQTPIEPPTHPVWGLALVVLGLTYHFFAYRADGLRKEMELSRHREHDAELVRSFQANYTDSRVKWVLDAIENDHSLMSDDDTFLENAKQELRSPHFHLLDEPLRQKAGELADRIGSLLRFTNHEFYVLTNATSSDRRCLKPDWNIDRSPRVPTPTEQKEYDRLASELSPLTAAVHDAYRTFFETAHQRVL